MKVRLTRTETERTVADEKTTGETVDEWYLELDMEDLVLGWESVGPLFEQLLTGRKERNAMTESQKQRQAEMVERFLHR